MRKTKKNLEIETQMNFKIILLIRINI